jgi:hypothetical protein
MMKLYIRFIVIHEGGLDLVQIGLQLGVVDEDLEFH